MYMEGRERTRAVPAGKPAAVGGGRDEWPGRRWQAEGVIKGGDLWNEKWIEAEWGGSRRDGAEQQGT